MPDGLTCTPTQFVRWSSIPCLLRLNHPPMQRALGTFYQRLKRQRHEAHYSPPRLINIGATPPPPTPAYDLQKGWWISVTNRYMSFVFASPCIFWNVHIKSNKPKSLWGPATGWELWGLNAGRRKRYFSSLKRAARLWSPPRFLFN